MQAEESETPSRAALRTAYLRRRWRVLFANLQRDIRSSEVTQIIACAVIGAVVGATKPASAGVPAQVRVPLTLMLAFTAIGKPARG